MTFSNKTKLVRAINEQLVDAKAELESCKLLPVSDFTYRMNIFPYIVWHGVDEKPKEVARLKAKIAALQEKKKGLKERTNHARH